MEIRTRRAERAASEQAPVPSPEKGRYLRRKPVQKVRRSPLTAKAVVRFLRLMVRSIAAAAACAGVIAAFVYAFSSEKFSLGRVIIIGCHRSDPARLEAIVRKEFPGHTLKIDLSLLQDRLEHEPWVRQVDVRRILPSELVIRVRERTPAVLFELNGELMVADGDAVPLERYDPRHGKLDVPVFKGLEGNDAESFRAHASENTARLKLGIRVLAELEASSPALSRNISEIDLSDVTNVKVLLLDDTAEILLGDRDIPQRLTTFLDNLPHYRELKTQYQEIAEVDMRFEGQIIYRPAAGTEEPTVETAAAEGSVPQQ